MLHHSIMRNYLWIFVWKCEINFFLKLNIALVVVVSYHNYVK